MATDLNLDVQLVNEAVALGHRASTRDAVNEALREYVADRRRLEALAVFGTVEFDPTISSRPAQRAETGLS